MGWRVLCPASFEKMQAVGCGCKCYPLQLRTGAPCQKHGCFPVATWRKSSSLGCTEYIATKWARRIFLDTGDSDKKTLRLDACRCYNVGGFRETMVEICWSMYGILSIHPLFAWKISNSLALALCIQRIPLCYPKLCLGNVHFPVAFGCFWLLD